MTCQQHGCGGPYTILSVHGIQLTALDNTAPTVNYAGTSNIWTTSSGWIRGAGWNASFTASDDSGICDMGATVASQVYQGPVDLLHNGHSWTQCPTPQTQSLTLDTTRYPNGPASLTFWAQDAASPANESSPTTTLHIDNAPVTISLSGPTDALSTSGTQYITATGTAGPSGISGYTCDVDGSPWVWHHGASVHIPVSGLGAHRVVCAAYNGARDPNGRAASSGSSSFLMTIRQPTVTGLWFPTVKNPIRCTIHKERIRIPGKWVTVFRHHKPVWVQRPGHTVVRKIKRCHARVVTRRTVTWTLVKRHGHKHWVKHVRFVRVVLPPTIVNSVVKRAAFGHSFTVVGWLGTSGLAPLAGQSVAVLAAPADGSAVFRQVATVTTSANGSWSATLAPGPSRLVEAVYLGSSTTEPASSNQATVSVPARLKLAIAPRHSHWGGKIQISGRVLGGYIPSSGELVVLYIGWTGGHTEIGHLYTDRLGRFSAPYRFLRGNGTEHYWIWAVSAKETDYPYASASSGRIPIVVSPRR